MRERQRVGEGEGEGEGQEEEKHLRLAEVGRRVLPRSARLHLI